ncbi:MAG: hypothetical protein KA533_02840 [Sphingobium sp.]|nr:hypothetical protein [Sphingobium sp.]MBP6112039.1 hypothetical protein [Sphingobium sp.]MBP8669827.1 hypothetical protein [Sphingobium sp.]MBP9156413.1 hypothetical protein [Sphingobium sp.]MCC6483081.1 hypothetical protein [Sphingomonadaceae bacterium]
MATDSFQTSSDMLAAPSRAPFAVTPHDSTELSIIPKALYVGTGGTVILRGVGGTADVTFKNVANGQVIDVRAQFVRATGTTAADIVALA